MHQRHAAATPSRCQHRTLTKNSDSLAQWLIVPARHLASLIDVSEECPYIKCGHFPFGESQPDRYLVRQNQAFREPHLLLSRFGLFKTRSPGGCSKCSRPYSRGGS